jgi:hypothetical protein
MSRGILLLPRYRHRHLWRFREDIIPHLLGFSFEPVLIRSIRKLMAGIEMPAGNKGMSAWNIYYGSSTEDVSL